MSYSVNPALWSRAFPVPADITDKHIKMCSGVALKCLLLILRSPDEFCDINVLAEKLNQPVSEISDALNYWEEQGVLTSISEGEEPRFKQPPIAAAAPAAPAAAPVSTPAPAPKIPAVSARPRFPREEALELIDSDKTLHSLTQELQEILKKPLTSADMDVLVALYSFYGLSAHYILSLVHYCATTGRRGMAYAERVAASWMSEGIDDAQVDSHIGKLMSRRENEGLVRREFGLGERSLTPREKEYISSWFDSLGFDITMIKLAYDITVDRTGKPAFSYMNKILINWNQSGIKTPEDVKREAAARASQNQTSGSKGGELDRRLLEQFMKE